MSLFPPRIHIISSIYSSEQPAGIWRADHVLPPSPFHLTELLSARIFANE